MGKHLQRVTRALWLRARYGLASVNQNNAVTTTDDLRFTLNYSVKL